MEDDLTEDEVYNIISNLMTGNNNFPNQDRDRFDIHVKKQIEERDIEYTKLLIHFVSITKIRNILREIFKWVFLICLLLIIGILVFVLFAIFQKFIKEATIEQMTEAIPLFITSIVGFVSVIISIPLTITKYLFSTKEDEYITNIILHTQEHDTSGRQWTLDYIKSDPEINDEQIIDNIHGL